MQLVAGVDEVGRGPLAGPVVAAAVILDPENPVEGLADSKKLSATKREMLCEKIKKQALSWALGRAEPEEIDAINILQASLLAMQRAVEKLHLSPSLVQVDGKHAPKLPYAVEAIIKGDSKIPAISAASIVAKVVRDQEMQQMHSLYPEYEFDRHKGYPTVRHRNLIEQHGICPIHRKSFAPIRSLLNII